MRSPVLLRSFLPTPCFQTPEVLFPPSSSHVRTSATPHLPSLFDYTPRSFLSPTLRHFTTPHFTASPGTQAASHEVSCTRSSHDVTDRMIRFSAARSHTRCRRTVTTTRGNGSLKGHAALTMTTLPSLPIEIFHHIVDELPRTWQKIRRRHDLKQLRLTCREIELKTRIRYGREFFFGLTVTVAPGCFEAPHSIMNDAIFRNSPTHLDICMDNDRTAFDETVDFQATIEYTKSGGFKMDLESLLTRAQRTTSLSLLSPRVSSGATMEIKGKIQDACHIMIRATLAIVSALSRLRLHSLDIGLNDPLSLETPVSLLYEMPSDSNAFDKCRD